MKTNRKPKRPVIKTHGGGRAVHINAEQQLARSVMACMLWEDGFYEDGQSIASRIVDHTHACSADKAMEIAIRARTQGKLRHVPLLVMRELARHADKPLIGDALAQVIQRADEITEFVALYWRDGKQPLSAQVKKGLAMALGKFDEYQLAKYDRANAAVRLRDVLFLTKAKPQTQEQAVLWRKLANNQLTAPDTWEVNLSAGKDKKATFTRLLEEGKLGYLALLRNLRLMHENGVSHKLIRKALIDGKGKDRVLPFRFVAAANAAPRFEAEIDDAMLSMLNSQTKLPGKTILIVDVSGSMYGPRVSRNSDMDRARAACALAAIAREVCEEPVIYATAGSDMRRTHKTALVPARRGLALVDAIFKMCQPLGGGGIFLKQVMDFVYEEEQEADRVIVITDEQDCSGGGADAPDKANLFAPRNYMINVAQDQNGIGYRKWVHIDGFSEAVMAYIQEVERQQLV